MSSQMEQFFKVLLCLVMVALLIGVGSKYLESNYAKFDVKDTVDAELAKSMETKQVIRIQAILRMRMTIQILLIPNNAN